MPIPTYAYAYAHTHPQDCDTCGGHLSQRKDDTEAVVANRLSVYAKETEPVIAHFRNLKNGPKVLDFELTGSVEVMMPGLRDLLGYKKPATPAKL